MFLPAGRLGARLAAKLKTKMKTLPSLPIEKLTLRGTNTGNFYAFEKFYKLDGKTEVAVFRSEDGTRRTDIPLTATVREKDNQIEICAWFKPFRADFIVIATY